MSGISVEWTGTFVDGALTATIYFGVDGDLPGACPMVAAVVGSV